MSQYSDEQRLIKDLFERLGNQGRVPKDRDAEALIVQSLRQNPDVAYVLVQSAIVYEHQIVENQDRIRQLETEMKGAEPPTSGSFLGGHLGGSVPPSGSRYPAPNSASRQTTASPWDAQLPSAERSEPQPVKGGGFLSSALSTVAGVAGGKFVADSLRDLFGGGPSHAAGSSLSHNKAVDQDAALKDANETQDELQDQLDDATNDSSDDSGEMDV